MAKTLPEKLQTMRCRACQSLIKPDKTLATELGRRRAVSSRDDCIYRCSCGVSYSNAKNEAERIMIKASPELNVPKQVRSGLAEALARTLNHRNRRRKQLQFCFEDSEDAVIWTVFRGLEEQGRLDALVAPQHPPGEPALLFWGAPVGGARSPEVAAALEEVCRSLGEPAGAYSEPDVALVWSDLVVLVEAKFQSGNAIRPNHPSFPRYLDRPELFGVFPETVAAAGYCELTGSWRIGTALAEALQIPNFLLVNLGPPDKMEVEADAFSRQLARSESRDFVFWSWTDILEAAAPVEAWLDRYASERHRLLYWR
jgi:hypothetical protein